MEATIKEIMVQRDQIERIRDVMEAMYGCSCNLLADVDDLREQRVSTKDGIECVSSMANLLSELVFSLATDVCAIREHNGLCKDGVEQDPPEGYNAKPVEGQHQASFHRLLAMKGN